MTKYAEGTTVSPEKSRVEIEGLVRKYGASKFASGWDDARATILFEAHGKRVRFVLAMPDAKERSLTHRARGYVRSTVEQKNAYDAEVRRRWRALALVIKAKLEVVESGIATFEEEFLAHIVLPDGRTVGEHAVPAVTAAYRGEPLPPLLGPAS